MYALPCNNYYVALFCRKFVQFVFEFHNTFKFYKTINLSGLVENVNNCSKKNVTMSIKSKM
ncbi:hypothetical protein BpHYR1_009322 [Brachionus plicatilis]|uniref:Uncharacterized protein n=1 Tax=Brachionus plicatilis TaxID=10195 RepID=A0A3M7T028_BRAPC|nr:hypothetical protein BpHYR1_009322 [Brachionus plicatilis]